ncbi:hypothetical protein PtrSN002B_005259 [Pyrenophora tritici-repentis]|uniref:DUF7730 domain-containing protein n=1 Tax=Pyrenophora tritici-repentis (strain Pt-1C-BFP) TaxID=426418 RepID=B2WIH9_PYRTR|nr:uncharacterized protein PTRG_09788 [Pyrenophora tritici-repentis Pt-1C-BFP]KAF7451064.1 hypothetical protein A1F99_056800 [Pyrenophora tritici-repentis]EDU42839.1 conserved hypothetical protein [Pyrenophora tritici-repentis Pt-1C-BFP]KAG9380722.1 hypothetical protein A1F94_008042 [Pyrenophora tritici-repentis]KAI0578260.1 hypothetical protein Alg215_06452 [Pyrenophora tritici-repentis]KAI0578356.1 hypothetical protein Alg130_07980 [Pyrenophora tritici-repentis]
MKPKTLLLGRLPGMRWAPHDIPSSEPSSSKPKSRNPFSLKSSTLDNVTPRPRKSSKPISFRSKPNVQMDAHTHAQQQSLFFALLPIELRRIVYDYVMGEEVVHMTLSTKRRYGHFVCDDEHVGGKQGRQCGCRVLVGGRRGARLDTACINLSRTCKLIYSEAISHLYRPHVFSLLHITHLLYLPSSLSQPRLNSIRTLHLRWAIRALPYLRRGPANRIAYREDTANWERGWQIIAGMEELRNLFVVLLDPSPQQLWERSWLELQDMLLESVKDVKRPREAVVVLPYPSCGTEWDSADSSVTLRSPIGGIVDQDDQD